MFTLYLLVSYICGALPWSVWLGLAIYKVDPRRAVDGNPGATNAFRVAGWRLGVAILILDFLKAFIPVFIARWGLDFIPDQLFWIALLPTFGHGFSIFLGFRGGRGIDTWFGVWTALTLYEVPLVMGTAAIIGSRLFKSGEARTLTIPLVLLPYLLLRHVDSWIVWLALAQLAILSVKLVVFYLGSTQRRQAARA